MTARRRRRPRPLTVLGVLLLVGGVGVAADVGWRTWVESPLAASRQEQAAAAQADRWSGSGSTGTPSTSEASTRPVVRREPRVAGTVAVIVVPRFGRDWRRVVRQGVDEETILNSFDAGVGHYPGTAMPGGLGNFAIAAHDTGYGDAFRKVERLRVDDLIHLQTRDGWYTYRFRNFQWVQPTQVGVIAPVPEQPDADPTARLITLTTCDPPYDAQEREIAYGTFVRFQAGQAPPPGVA